ncbi:MAG: rhamnulokinase [Oscillospiraceae bacterium]|nr:rhamnulokinase [Oscillospiraceae bacterium]
MKRALAVDLGASSGRLVAGWREGGEVHAEEVHRFPNSMDLRDGHRVWDAERLLREVRTGIEKAMARYGKISSLAIDTWGVDYVLLRGEEPVSPVYAYRDERTGAAVEAVHAVVPFPELYRRTGCQFQPFNTVYQLMADKLSGRLEGVTDLLMLPEYLSWRLCGKKAREYTSAATTGLLSVRTGEYDRELIRALGLPEGLFPPLSKPGTPLGEYKGIPVLLCASHDTASAVEGIPELGDEPYLSSGTWSLLGLKTPAPLTDEASRRGNWSNEGGVGYNRYQKNIMGLWLVNELRRELCPETSLPDLLSQAEKSSFDGLADADSPAFLAPGSMAGAFREALGGGQYSAPALVRCACRSLAASYAAALGELAANTGRRFCRLTVVGGGAKNAFLNRLTAEASGLEVRALPLEATALGNLKIQMGAEL